MLNKLWLPATLSLIFLLVGIIVGSYSTDISGYVHSHDVLTIVKEIIPLAGWLSAVCALLALLWNVSQARYKMEIELIIRMGERFDSEQMLSHRVQASRYLLDDNREDSLAVNSVLDFFEEIAFLVEKKAISDEVAWQYFSYWVLKYVPATERYVKSAGEMGTDIFVFHRIKNLYEKLLDVEKDKVEKAGKPFEEVDEEKIKEFLKQESCLQGKPQRFRVKPSHLCAR